ncbi:MAG TPA: copper ion binding protein [Bacillota bacterium]|jgi:copper chaperone
MAETKKVIKVTGMSCNHCKMAVHKALSGLSGVQSVEVDLGTGNVAIDYDTDKVGVDDFRRAVTGAGYEVAG